MTLIEVAAPTVTFPRLRDRLRLRLTVADKPRVLAEAVRAADIGGISPILPREGLRSSAPTDRRRQRPAGRLKAPSPANFATRTGLGDTGNVGEAGLLPQVLILLASFNGAAHLWEQLQSLATQQGVVWSLLWRDDGSDDETIAILDEFATAHPGRVARLSGGGRLGAGASFMRLLAEAPDAEFYAFMDQDDVWLPGKLARAIAAMTDNDLVCTRLQLVAPDLREIALSPLPSRPPNFATLLAHNVAAGCTMVLTARARSWALAAPMPEGGLHDWWCALAVTGCGGCLSFDPEPSLLYRQHSGNLVGGGVGRLDRMRRMLGRGSAGFYAPLVRLMAALPALPLTQDARGVLAALQGLRAGSPFRRLAAVRQAGLAHHARLGDALLRTWVLLRRMP